MSFFDRENQEILKLREKNSDLQKVTSAYGISTLAGNSLHVSNIYNLFGFTQVIKDPAKGTLDTSGFEEGLSDQRSN